MTRTPWPDLKYDEWKETAGALHMWTQVVGKVRLACSRWVNHSWHVTLYVTPRGLTTSGMTHGDRLFQIDFDFIDQKLIISASDGGIGSVPLEPQSTADFYSRLMKTLAGMDLSVRIHSSPNEVEHPVRFDQDTARRAYDPQAAVRFWRALVQVDRVFREFRAGFIGKCSPVHFFWGSFDLAVTRFSGRRAPAHPGGFPHMPDTVTREAYSHEVSSAGFWPGGEASPTPIFYSYAYPPPEGFADRRVQPADATWSRELGEFLLPYDAVRTSASPDGDLLAFLESTYEAAAEAGSWNRTELERAKLP